MSDSKYVNTTEMAKHFGVAKATILAMMRSGEIPEGTYVRIGRVFRFDLPAIERHLLTTAAVSEEDGASSNAPAQLELPYELIDDETENEN
jgi:excisionase family DNA binding protein